jgi:acyl-coenzyme A synthetase/AMP-(fatty) acid ligase
MRETEYVKAEAIQREDSPYLKLIDLVERHPEVKDVVAIKQGDESITYSQLLEKIEYVSRFFDYDLQSEKGENISICAPGSIDGIVSFFAMNKLGLVNARIFNGAPKEKFKKNLLNFESRTIMVDEENLKTLTFIANQTKIKNVVLISKCDSNIVADFKEKNPDVIVKEWQSVIEYGKSCDKNSHNQKIYESDLASILYTSGTSGEPKPLAIPNRTYTKMKKSVMNTTNEKEANGETVLGVVSHEYPYAAVNSTVMILLLGKTSVLNSNDKSKGIDFIEMFEQKLNKIQAIPNFYKLLIDLINKMSNDTNKDSTTCNDLKYSLRRYILENAKNKTFHLSGYVWLSTLIEVKAKLSIRLEILVMSVVTGVASKT